MFGLTVPSPDVSPEECQGGEKAVLQDGLDLCCELYAVLKPAGYFPALTGGLVYKTGERKDIDIMIYRHRQDIDHFEMPDIFDLLSKVGLSDFQCFGFVTKARWKGITVDLFNPETLDGDEYSGH
jgi:hypothetical protein